MTIAKLIVKLAELICDAFEEQQFSMLIFEEVPEDDFDYSKDAQGENYKARSFATVRWAHRTGQSEKVLWLAKLVAGRRPKRTDLQQLATDIEGAIQPVQRASGGNSQIPEELAVGIALVQQQLPNPLDHARDLRDLLRKADYKTCDLAGRFHLSERDVERLAAVLWLERAPDVKYLRWLSERVTVEPPFISFMAGKALTTATLKLSNDDLHRAIVAAKNASDLLDGLVDVDDQPAAGFELAARKEQVRAALTLADMRSKKGRFLIAAPDLDAFLAELVHSFNRDSFDLMCRNRLQTASKYLGAHPNDPMDLIVVHVFLTCKGKWERELIRAAHDEQPASPVFGNLYDRYVVKAGAAG